MARPLCGFQIQMIQSPHIYQWMGMSVSFGKHWAKCCQDHLVSLSKQLPLTPRNNSSTVALLRLTHFFWPKIHGVRRSRRPSAPAGLTNQPRDNVTTYICKFVFARRKNTANICDTFCRAQKKAKKNAVFFAERKIYCKN